VFVCAFTNQLHFAYNDDHLNIQDCWYDEATNSWNLQQINDADGNGPTVPGETVVCPKAPGATTGPFICTFGDQQHFAYVDGNLIIQDCWYDGATNSWNVQQINNDPTAVCAQAPEGASPPFVCTFGDQQHFAYVDANRNIQDCWYDGATSSWNLQQINNASGPTVSGEFVACSHGPGVSNASNLFVCTFGDQQHFAYFDGNGNIQDCWYDDSTRNWTLQQINNASGPTVSGEFVACPQATAAAGNPVFICVFTDQQHFAYVDANGKIQDCYWTGGG
jgi:hypothetical protein